MSPSIRTIFLAAAVLAAGCTWAQAPAAAQPATQAAPSYRSAFEGYRPFEAGEVQDWRKSNDTVRDIGGWRAYAREVQGGAAPASAQPATPPASTGLQTKPADAHRGHPQ